MTHFRVPRIVIVSMVLSLTSSCLPTGVVGSRALRAATHDASLYDVVVYGGTSAGIAAAIQARRMGGSVVVVEPGRRIGGLTSDGHLRNEGDVEVGGFSPYPISYGSITPMALTSHTNAPKCWC